MQLVRNIIKEQVEFNFPNNENLIPGIKDFLRVFAEKILYEKFSYHIESERLPLLYADSLKIFFQKNNHQYYFIFFNNNLYQNKIDFELLNYFDNKTLIEQEIDCELNNGEVIWGFSIGKFDIYNFEEIPQNICHEYIKSLKIVN